MTQFGGIMQDRGVLFTNDFFVALSEFEHKDIRFLFIWNKKKIYRIHVFQLESPVICYYIIKIF